MDYRAFSNRNRRRSLRERFFTKILVDPVSGCWKWLGAKSSGRAVFWFRGQQRPAAHFVLEVLAGLPRPDKDHGACHHCDNPACVNPKHLYWGTAAENGRDFSERGTFPPRLSPEQALAIYEGSGTHQSIADRFGTTRQNVTHIKGGKSWAAVTGHVREAPAT